LALRGNLRRRGMELDTRCVLCQRYDEDGAHLFFKCKWAKKVRRELGLEQIRGDLSFLSDAKQCVDCILTLSAD
jgi:hypothetical protein